MPGVWRRPASGGEIAGWAACVGNTHTHPHTPTPSWGPSQAGPVGAPRALPRCLETPHLKGARTHCGHGHSLRGRTKGAVGRSDTFGSKRNSSLCFSWRKSSRQRDAGFGSEGYQAPAIITPSASNTAMIGIV